MTDEANQNANRRARRQRRRRIAKWIKWSALGLLGAAILVALIVALMPRAIEVEMARVARRDMRVIVAEDGKTRAKSRYVLSTPLSGTIDRIRLQPGDHVEEGEALLRVVPPAPPLLDTRSRANLQTRLSAARAALELARAEVARAETAREEAERQAEKLTMMAEKDAVPRERAQQARFQLEMRTEELRAARFAAKLRRQDEASARAALGLMDDRTQTEGGLDIIAPVSGEILRILRPDEEGLVAAGTPLLEIADLSAIEIVADVLSADAVDIQPGAPVRIVRWGGEHALYGHVTRVEPAAFTSVSALGVEEQRVQVIIELDSPRDEWTRLGDGYRVEVEITLWSGKDVPTIPASAVFRNASSWAVYQANEGVARLRSIEVGHRNDELVEVVSGLEPGDQVVLHPSDRVADGVEVSAPSDE